MKFNELYSRLTKCGVILENPDSGNFSVPNDDGTGTVNMPPLTFATGEAITFVVMDDAIFYGLTDHVYHGTLCDVINKFFKNGYMDDDDIKRIGRVSDKRRDAFSSVYKYNDYISRSDVLLYSPDIIQGRLWYHDGYSLISIWNSLDKITPKNVRGIKNMVKAEGHDTEKIYVEVNNDNPSININELLNPDRNKVPKTAFDSSILHIASPDVKKQQLLKMGARPKSPLDIRHKQQQRQGD